MMSPQQKNIHRLYLQKYLQSNPKNSKQFSKTLSALLSAKKNKNNSQSKTIDNMHIINNNHDQISQSNHNVQEDTKLNIKQCNTNQNMAKCMCIIDSGYKNSHNKLYLNQPIINVEQLTMNNRSMPIRLRDLQYTPEQNNKSHLVSQLMHIKKQSVDRKKLRTTLGDSNKMALRYQIQSTKSKRSKNNFSDGNFKAKNIKMRSSSHNQVHRNQSQKQKWLSHFKLYLTNFKSSPRKINSIDRVSPRHPNYIQCMQLLNMQDNSNTQYVPIIVSNIHQQYMRGLQMSGKHEQCAHSRQRNRGRNTLVHRDRVTTQRIQYNNYDNNNNNNNLSHIKYKKRDSNNTENIDCKNMRNFTQIRNTKNNPGILNRDMHDQSELKPWNYQVEEF